ncbi:LacI family DNA-binding transcriptional regulator [Alteromonas gracilis]|uniref:LacI family DNA-binding transcriptional regulator n=1 Tax=Alteromonas gracilis TaxID=1479524 RepID=UPI003734D3C4
MPTIYQVAERAGVSLSTVSRVLNGKASVNAALRERVEKAVKELNYRPSTVARSLANSRTDSVGVLVPELDTTFFSEIVQSLESIFRAENKHIIIAVGGKCTDSQKKAVDFLVSRNCDALIVHAQAVTDDYLKGISESKLPIAFIDQHVESLPNASFNFDHEKGGYLATRHLLELGHQNIAYISGPAEFSESAIRVKGYKRALSEAGIPIEQPLIFNGDNAEDGGKAGLLELLSQDLPFTAIVCANDLMASGVISCARELGMSLPQDLSIVGGDNAAFAQHVFPRLTTIDMPTAKLAEMAAKYVLNRVYAQNNDVEFALEPSIVPRDSTVQYQGY